MCCALHLLMFCFSYLCNNTIPRRRETLSLFPHGTREITGPRYPLRPWNDLASRNTGCTLRPTISWNPSLFGTGLPTKSFWRALKFLGGKRCGTLRPFPSRPSPQSPSSTQIPHFLRPHRVSTGTISSSVPPRAGVTCGLPRISVPRRRTRREERCSLLARCCRVCLRRTAFDCCRRPGARTGHLLPFVQAFVLGMHESCFILGEKCGLGMVALPF